MKTYTAATPQITAADVLRVLVQLVIISALYGAQLIGSACRLALIVANTCAEWLRSSHNFTPGETEEGEKVILTGWQYIGVAFAVCVFALALAIDWNL